MTTGDTPARWPLPRRPDQLVRTIRVRNRHEPGVFGRLATAIGDRGATLGTISTVGLTAHATVRDLDVLVDDAGHLRRVLDAIAALPETTILEVRDEVLEAHRGGKIRTVSRRPIDSLAALRTVYTPGVAEVCLRLRDEPDLAHLYTGIGRTVAIVTDGTAILGLGPIGPVAGMPVMEGKAALLEQLVGLSGAPVLLGSADPDEIVRVVRTIAPGYGAILLEDIASPACFEIESRLRADLALPVFHDDQQGTAAVALAALRNACRLVGRDIRAVHIGCIGLGAAGHGIATLLKDYTGRPILGADIDSTKMRRHAADGNSPVPLEHLLATADVVIATTGVPGLIRPAMVRPGQVILALSNPEPEITPRAALAAGAAYAADGAAVNNVLGFPGLLRGALEARARCYVPAMFVAAGEAIAAHAGADELVPYPLDRRVHQAVTLAVARAAVAAGVARVAPDEDLLAATFAGDEGERRASARGEPREPRQPWEPREPDTRPRESVRE
jgi:malate dehydrogenase (oxaloacetate-decarboxylating)